MIKKIKSLIFVLLILIMPIKISALSTLEEQREAIIETANAYKRQKTQIQYDSFRKNLYLSPEDATSQRFLYTVCSGFTFSLYKQALGIEIPDLTETLLKYAEQNKDNKDIDNVVFYYSGSELSEMLANRKEFIKKIVEDYEFLPGDLLVYSGTGGHVVLVLNEKTNDLQIMDSMGTRYDQDSYIEHFESNGSIRGTSLSYTMPGDITKIALIRVITEDRTYISRDGTIKTYTDITDSAKSRLEYKGIDIEKTVEVSGSSSSIFANIGDEITYTITITNNSDSIYSNLNIIENIDSNLSVIDKGNGNLSDNALNWNISIDPKSTVTLKYTVKVPNNKSLLGEIIISNGKVANISTSRTEILIGNKLTKEQTNLLIKSFNELQNNNQIEREFINQIYLNSLNINMGLNKLTNLDIISYDGTNSISGTDYLSVKHTKINDTSVKKYIYGNFYGLRIASSAKPENSLVRAWEQWNITPTYELNDRARTLTSENLLDGDILLVYDDIDKSYIYLNNSLYRKTAEKLEQISGDELTTFLRNVIGENYIVLRPSLALVDEEKPKQDINITEKPKDESKEQIKNPDTGINLRYGALIILVIMSVSVYLMLRKKSMFKKHN